MSAYLEACLSALQNSDDERLAYCEFSGQVDVSGELILVFKVFSGDVDHTCVDGGYEWYFSCRSLVCSLMNIGEAAHVVAVLEILNSVPRGDSDE